MSLPRNVSPAAARRRALLVDVVVGVLIGIVAIVVSAGIGVVGFLGLLCALILVLWYLLEGPIVRIRRRRAGPRSARPGAPRPAGRREGDRDHDAQLDRQ